MQKQFILLTQKRSPFYDERKMLDELPTMLRRQVVLLDQGTNLFCYPLFAKLELEFPGFISEVGTMLLPVQLNPGECLVADGESIHTVFFLIKGAVQVVTGPAEKPQIVKEFTDGGFFGETFLYVPNNMPFTYKYRSFARDPARPARPHAPHADPCCCGPLLPALAARPCCTPSLTTCLPLARGIPGGCFRYSIFTSSYCLIYTMKRRDFHKIRYGARVLVSLPRPPP